jgi:4-hydroxybenzoate polyprenyltransferase
MGHKSWVAGGGLWSERGTLWTLLVHLRLPFQLLLAPVFLWGWLLGGGGFTPTLLLAFLAFHVFLYGGATAFNSYYDRDEGPVGGLERPPPIVAELLPFSLAVKAFGWLLAALVNWAFFLAYGGFVLFSLAYSHPLIRLKGRPLAGVISVGVGQGVVAFLGGWAASRGDLTSAWSPEAFPGMLAAALLIVGLYPLTQLHQVEEDRARGDRTLAVAQGPRACFVFALVCQAVGGLALVVTLFGRYGAADAALVAIALLVQLAAVAHWAAEFDERRVLANFRRVMRLNTLSAGGLALYLGYHLLLG